MKTPEKKHYDYDKEIDFLCEECLSLAKDIIEMDEDIEGLTDWTEDFTGHYNNALENINHNFEVLDNRTKNLTDEISNLDYHRICLWVIVGANALITFLMLIDVL